MAIIKDRMRQIKEDLLKGGLSDDLTLKDIADKHKVDISELRKQFQMGIEVEKEHTDNESVAKEITLDHLFEDPEYYTKLANMENGEGAQADSTNKEIKLSKDCALCDKILKIWNIDNSWDIFVEKYDTPFKLEIEAKKDNKKIELYICINVKDQKMIVSCCLIVVNGEKEEYNSNIEVSIEDFITSMFKQNDILRFAASANDIVKNM